MLGTLLVLGTLLMLGTLLALWATLALGTLLALWATLALGDTLALGVVGTFRLCCLGQYNYILQYKLLNGQC